MTTFPSDERPGASVFFKNEAGEVFHTYSSYGRGLDMLIGAYNFLDWRPRAATKQASPTAWPGFAITTDMTARSSIRKRRISSRRVGFLLRLNAPGTKL